MKRTMPLRCGQCGQAFRRPGSLQKHINRHREAREWNEREDRKAERALAAALPAGDPNRTGVLR